MGKEDVISAQLTGADEHDSTPAVPMITHLKDMGIKRFVADRGYDDDKIRAALNEISIKADIPPRKNRTGHRPHDNTVYKWRWRVEALFGKLKENRRIALRVDKLDTSYIAFIALAFIAMEVC